MLCTLIVCLAVVIFQVPDFNQSMQLDSQGQSCRSIESCGTNTQETFAGGDPSRPVVAVVITSHSQRVHHKEDYVTYY